MQELSTLKVGDKVIVTTGRFPQTEVVQTVQRETKTQLIVGGERYSKSNGVRIGRYNGWHTPKIKVATDELIAKTITKQKSDALLSQHPITKLMNDEMVNEIYDFLASKNVLRHPIN